MENRTKHLIGAILWIFVFVSLFIVAFFVDKFWNSNIWDNPANWGVFADYFGGLINPLIGLSNLGFLIYISFLIEKKNDTRNLYQFRHEALVKLNSLLSGFPPFAIDPDEFTTKYVSALLSFEQGYAEVFHLFPDNNKDYESLHLILEKVYYFGVKYVVAKLPGSESTIDQIESYRNAMILSYVSEFSEARSKYIAALRKSLQ